MQLLLIGLVLIALIWLLYRTLFVKRKSREKAEQKLKAFDGLLRKLRKNEAIEQSDVMSLAKNPSTRHALFGILQGFDRTDLFPPAYFTLEKSAESFVVNWLEFPTELNAPPDQIELFTDITLNDGNETYEYMVFKYKKSPPPKSFPNEWVLAVAGPFGPESRPYELPLRVFSRFNEVGTVSAMDEVRWVHEHINRK